MSLPIHAKLHAALEEVERLQREKKARCYYQNIIYEVCSVLDAIERRHISHGDGIVCGTLETPETEVEQAMGRIKAQIEQLQHSEETAWGLIANAWDGDWNLAGEASGWKKAAEKWRDEYHKRLPQSIIKEAERELDAEQSGATR